jgi:hypothetical protein
MFSHVEILAENSALNVQRIASDHMYNGLSEVNRDTFIPLHRGITGGNATLEAGDVAVCYVPLFRCMLQEPNYVYTAGFQNHLIVRDWWRGGCTLSASDIEVCAVNLLVQSYHYDASIRQQILSRYMSGPKIDFRFANTKVMRTQESLTYNSRHQIRLSGFNGLVTSITIIARIGGTSVRIDKAELLDPQGMSLSGGQPIEYGYVDTIIRADQNRYCHATGDASLETSLWFMLPVGGDQEALSNDHG